MSEMRIPEFGLWKIQLCRLIATVKAMLQNREGYDAHEKRIEL